MDWRLDARCDLAFIAYLVVNPTAAGAHHQEGEHHDDDEERPGQRGGVAHAEHLEGLAVQVEHVEERGVEGAAVGGNKGLGEGLRGADDAQYQVEEDGGGQEGQGDGPKLLPGVCLLYTSPSPRDRTRSRMPSSA